MKHGTTPTLEVSLPVTPEEVAQVEFAFRETRAEGTENLFIKAYPGDSGVSYDFSGKHWIISLTAADTWKLTAHAECYMDTKITLPDGSIPETEIVTLGKTEITFFEEGG